MAHEIEERIKELNKKLDLNYDEKNTLNNDQLFGIDDYHKSCEILSSECDNIVFIE